MPFCVQVLLKSTFKGIRFNLTKIALALKIPFNEDYNQ